jgi:hypothetical protein
LGTTKRGGGEEYHETHEWREVHSKFVRNRTAWPGNNRSIRNGEEIQKQRDQK